MGLRLVRMSACQLFPSRQLKKKFCDYRFSGAVRGRKARRWEGTQGNFIYLVMADVFSKKKRSEVMSRIRSKNTKPEMLVRKYLHGLGFRYRLHSQSLQGKPDLALPKYKTVVFVHGCFWHGHKNPSCNVARVPKSNTKFWIDKISYNQSRHVTNLKELKKSGWLVLTVWECDLKPKSRAKTLENLVKKIIQQA